MLNLPVYTELSNFSTRVNGKKVSTDITVTLIVNSSSDPVQSINSIYQFLERIRYKSEFILLNLDREGYQYEKLLSTFPVMRVLFPQEKINIKDAVSMALHESLSNTILFLDPNFLIESLSLEVLDMYLSESSFGMLIPLIISEKGETIPNIVKGNIQSGFLSTISMDIVGTAVSSIYSKYFCFLLNREAVLSRNIQLESYQKPQFTLLDLGYKLWKEGYIITQARNFKVKYLGTAINDIKPDFDDKDYLLFHYKNITENAPKKGRKLKMIWVFLSWLVRFKAGMIRYLFLLWKEDPLSIKINSTKPVEDLSIITIINKDIK